MVRTWVNHLKRNQVRRAYLLLLLLWLIHCGSTPNVHAQSEMVIEDISSQTGLPNGSINCVGQDETGFIWIGTWKGLFRYDGYSVINFSLINPEFSALKITDLHVNGNKLWVGSFVSGFYCIDLKDYRFLHYHKQAAEGFIVPDNDILSISSEPNGRVAVATERGGLIIIGTNNKVELCFNPENSPEVISINQVSRVQGIGPDEFAFSTNKLTILNLLSEKIDTISNPEFNTYITSFFRISEKEYYIGNGNGFFHVKRQGMGFVAEKVLSISTNAILKLKGFNSNNFLLGTADGVYEYNADSGGIRKFSFNKDEKTSSQNIRVLKYTHDDAIMIGSENGLFSLISRKQHFNHIGLKDPIGVEPIISSIRKTGDQIFVGSWGQGLFILNKKDNLLVPIDFEGSSSIDPKFIYALELKGNKIYFSCRNYHGIFSFDYTSKPYRFDYQPFFLDQTGERKRFIVTSIYNSDYRGLMLGTWEGLLFFQDPISGGFKAVAHPEGRLPSTKNYSIFSIMEDSDRSVWLGANGGGVVRLNFQNQQISDELKITSENGLVSNFVTQIYQTRNGRVWFGTEEGLSYYEKGKVETPFPKDIVFDIQSMMEDPIGFLWLGTQNGILRVNSNQPDEPYKHFDQADGLTNKSFYINCIEQDEQFTFYFGGFNGIDYFTPYKIEYNYKKPTTKITDFFILNQRQYPVGSSAKSVLKYNIAYTSTIKLKYNQNTFSISFSNLEYQIPEKCQFAFMLSGIDQDWNYRDAENRIAYYTKLSPGKYTFNVKSTNNDGIWSEQPTTLDITISPPFWASTWAFLFYLIIVMLLFFLFTYTKVANVETRHRQQLKELEFNKQRDLDELKLKFFTNISHEFRTPLTLILGPVARIISSEKNDPFHDQHLLVYRNASRLLHLTNRIIDFRKNEKEQLKLKVGFGLLTDFLYNIFLFFKYEAENRDIAYTYKSDWEGKSWFDREFVESITFNLLSNAFKYTPAGRSISLILSREDEWLRIRVQDTGNGIEKEDQEKIFERFYSSNKYNSAGIGLSFTRRLVELHKGKIELKSETGKGSVFSVYLPADDRFSEAEKSHQENKENIMNWAKPEIEIKNRANDQARKIKSLFLKDELIALIVDDNLDVRLFLRSLLEDQFKILEAENGEEGLKLAITSLPDIVISDVMMPGMSGLELCEKIKADVRTDHIPVILTTVLSSHSDRLEGLKKGADSYIPKPIDPDHLLIRVNNLIERQLKIREKFKLVDSDEGGNDQGTEKPLEIEVNPLIEKAREIVLKNIDNSEYSIDDFCLEIGLSRMQLYRKFKAITGLSANSFIRKVRLHKAAELIKTGNYSIKEVTYDVGFTDLKYFRKCFYDEFGVNPSEFGGR